MRRRDDPTPPAVSFPSPFPSRTAPSHSERRTRACGEGPKRGEKGATRVENGGPVVTENPTEGNWTVSRLSTSRSLRLFISLHSLPSFLGTEWRGWEASVTRRTDDERSERGWSERVSDKRRVTTEDPYDPASVGSCLTAQPGLPHGLSSSAHTVPIPFTLAALNLTSRKGSFMKVSIILGDRRERSEQREPRMGGNRSERSRVSSGVVDSRPFLRHVRFISLSILLHSTLSGRRPPVASLRGWSRVMNVVNEPDDRRRVTRPAPNPPHLVTHAANPTHPVPRYALSLPITRVSPPHVTLSLLITRSVHVGSYPLLPFTSRSERKWVKWGGERYERHEPRARILHRFNGWFLGVPDGVFRSVCQSFTLPSLPSPRSVPYGHVPRDEGRRWTTWVNRQTETRRESDVEGQERGENGRGNHW